MRFYQENEINPLASCLPLLLQLPVFISLYYMLKGDSFQHDVTTTPPEGWLFIDSLIQPPGGRRGDGRPDRALHRHPARSPAWR